MTNQLKMLQEGKFPSRRNNRSGDPELSDSSQPKKDLILIHGMFASAIAMHQIKKALEERECYGRIQCARMPLDHRVIPRLNAEKHAREILKYWVPKLRRGVPFDVLGHSNGGYVAQCLHQLHPSRLEYVFTVATPSLFSTIIADYGTPKGRKNRIVHFVGKLDFLGAFSGEKYDDLVFSFPDEGHCSIHTDADTNGLANILAIFATKKRPSPPIFLDNDGTLHLWPWCSQFAKRAEKPTPRELFRTGRITVCNGMHNENFEELKRIHKKECGEIRDSALLTGDLASYLFHRVVKHLKLRQDIKTFQKEAKSELRLAKAEGKKLKKELAALRNRNDLLETRLQDVDTDLNSFLDFAESCLKKKIERILEPLYMFNLLMETLPAISDSTLIQINHLLQNSIQASDVLMKSLSSGLPNDGRQMIQASNNS